MVENNEDPKMTAFAITVDAKLGTSTGISAGDRARTLRALADLEVSYEVRVALYLTSFATGHHDCDFPASEFTPTVSPWSSLCVLFLSSQTDIDK